MHKYAHSYLCLALGLLLAFTACGGDASVVQKEIPSSSAEEKLELPQKDLEVFEAEVERRMQAGDTLVIDHDRLGAVLPDAIDGFELDVNKASTFETKRFAFAEAIRVFYNDQEDYLEFIIGDYVGDPDFFRANLQRYNDAQGETIEGVVEKKVSGGGLAPQQASDFFAWSLFNSERRMARFYIGINFRYFLTLEISGVDGPVPSGTIREWLDLEALVR